MSRGFSRHITHGELRIHAEERGLYGVYRGGPPGAKIGTIQKDQFDNRWYNIAFGLSHGPYSTLKFAISRFEGDAK